MTVSSGYHFRVKKQGPANWSGSFKATEMDLFCARRPVFSLRLCQRKLICELGSHLLCWLFSVYLLRGIFCPCLPCSVSRKLGPPPLPLSFQPMPEKGWGIYPPHSFRSSFGFHSSSGMAMTPSQVASLPRLQFLQDSSHTSSSLLL